VTNAEIVARADANYVAMWSLYGSAHDRGEVRERAGIVCVSSGLPIAMFNNVFVTRPLAEPERQIAESAAFLDGLGLPFVVRIREGLDAASEVACERLGMPYSDTVPGMALAPIGQIPRPMPGLEIRIADGAGELAQHRRILVEVFGFPAEVTSTLVPDALLDLPDCELYVGYADGEPAATAGLFVSHRTAGIWNVATVPSHRGRGIGEAMTGHAVRRGAELGCVMANLQASEMGRPVYERMGFRPVAPYRTHHRPGV
jgi:GNAT superfamily N-acetyltransferase